MDLYNQAREIAFSNAMKFKVGAVLLRENNPVAITCCSLSKDKKWARRNGYHGQTDTTTHAEMAALLHAQPGDHLHVLRWRANGELTMAHPCPFCLNMCVERGIAQITYSDWNGKMQTLQTSTITEDDLEWWSIHYYRSKPRSPRW